MFGNSKKFSRRDLASHTKMKYRSAPAPAPGSQSATAGAEASVAGRRGRAPPRSSRSETCSGSSRRRRGRTSQTGTGPSESSRRVGAGGLGRAEVGGMALTLLVAAETKRRENQLLEYAGEADKPPPKLVPKAIDADDSDDNDSSDDRYSTAPEVAHNGIELSNICVV